MNTDLTRIERTVLNTFDLLGKVGGVYGLLANIAVTILSFINFQKKDNIIVSKLFSKSNKAISASSKFFPCRKIHLVYLELDTYNSAIDNNLVV